MRALQLLQGKTHVFGDNIDTDQIYPGRYLDLTAPAEIAAHCMEGADSGFADACSKGDIVVAGRNFGCGSSREHAAIALSAIGVSAVIAKSFARIFYRNAINLGLPVLICPDIDNIARRGGILTVDMSAWTVSNAKGALAKLEPVSDYALSILEAGGIKPLLRAQP